MEYNAAANLKHRKIFGGQKKRLVAIFLLAVLLSSVWLGIIKKPQTALAAVTRTGSVTNIQSTADNSSQSVTVPADATLAVVTIEGFSSTTTKISGFTALTLGGSGMTLQRSDLDSVTDGDQSGIFTLLSPSTGTQTLAWNWGGSGAWSDGGQINVAFYKGVDGTTPVGSKGGQGINGSANSATASSGSLSISSGDAVVSTAYYSDFGTTSTMASRASWTNTTAVTGPSLFTGSVGSYAETFPSAGTLTVSSVQILAGNTCFTTMSTIVLKSVSNAAPAAPTLIAPASSATGVAALPLFQLRTTDADSDYLRYDIKVYDNSGGTGSANCTADSATNLVRDIDQNSSQTGWSSQDQQASTAYTGNSVLSSSTIASHTYQATGLAVNTTYFWKGRAKDPGGTNTFGSWSACQSFTTLTASGSVQINGGTTIQGGTIIQ